MEHRYHNRIILTSTVELRRDNRFLGCYMLRDISFGGLGLEVSIDDPKLKVNEVVEITLKLDQDNKSQFQVKGLVIHRSHTFTGLMFVDINVDLMRLLMDLMHQAA